MHVVHFSLLLTNNVWNQTYLGLGFQICNIVVVVVYAFDDEFPFQLKHACLLHAFFHVWEIGLLKLSTVHLRLKWVYFVVFVKYYESKDVTSAVP